MARCARCGKRVEVERRSAGYGLMSVYAGRALVAAQVVEKVEVVPKKHDCAPPRTLPEGFRRLIFGT